MKFYYTIINSVLIFLISKYFLKGYKYIPKTSKDNNPSQNKSISNNISSKYDYSSSYYNPKNITCESLGVDTWALLHSVAAIYPNYPNETEKEEVIHKNVRCDGCKKYPITGIRYKCTICHNFDYCEDCEKKFNKEHNHPFLKIRKPELAHFAYEYMRKQSFKY